jgi:hypothetical protein
LWPHGFPHSDRYDERATITLDVTRYEVGIILSRPKIFSVVESGCCDVKHPLNPRSSSHAAILASEFPHTPTMGRAYITVKYKSKVDEYVQTEKPTHISNCIQIQTRI